MRVRCECEWPIWALPLHVVIVGMVLLLQYLHHAPEESATVVCTIGENTPQCSRAGLEGEGYGLTVVPPTR